MAVPSLILASASPRRAELLLAAGIAFEVVPGAADETVHAGETPIAYVRRVARAKAETARGVAAGRAVLAADTVVVVDGLILGKPTDAADARRMLERLSGRTHLVLTGVCLLTGDACVDVEVTSVEFAPLSHAEIADYVASGEPMDKAGSYAVQGLGSRFVRRVSGSYSNVVGLPVALVYRLLSQFAPATLTRAS